MAMPRTLRPGEDGYTLPRYTPIEAGIYLGGRSRKAVYRLVAEGHLAFFQERPRGPMRFAQSDLDAFLQTTRHESTVQADPRRRRARAVSGATAATSFGELPPVPNPRFAH